MGGRTAIDGGGAGEASSGAGNGGSAGCPGSKPDCRNAEGGFSAPTCNNGRWECPPTAGPCEDFSASSGGSAGIGDELFAACLAFCTEYHTQCASASGACESCVEDCALGYAREGGDCASASLGYLACAAPVDKCGSGHTTPASCTEQGGTLIGCYFSALPVGCGVATTEAWFDGCQLTLNCDEHDYQILCDSENEGNGTSLCDCERDADYTGTELVLGIGVAACKAALAACGFPG